MAFCRLSQDSIANTTTTIDNLFINNYLPFAPDNCVKVYLYGLYKCQDTASKDNNIENFANELKMTTEDVVNCFYYWQEQGLVQVIEVIPLEVRYLPITNVLNGIKKYNVKKYGTFNVQAQEILTGRMITPKEYEEYYNIIENYHVEKEALLMTIKYCVDSKNDDKISYSYITTVAKDWANRGITTCKQVEEQILQFESLSSGLEMMLKAMKLKRLPTIAERTLYKTWQELGFDEEVLIYIAKSLKHPSFEYIDELVKRYYSMKFKSVAEIENYEAEKKECIKIAKSVTSNLGLYYENLGPVVDNYIYKWLNMGFSVDMLNEIATYCFKTNIRTLDGMDSALAKFHKMGIVSKESLGEYFGNVLATDEKIKEILTGLGLTRNVNQYDRDKYRLWTEVWNMSQEVISYATTLAQGKEQPMQYLASILSSYHEKHVTTVDEAKGLALSVTKPSKKLKNQREYSRDDMNALFDTIQEVEV